MKKLVLLAVPALALLAACGGSNFQAVREDCKVSASPYIYVADDGDSLIINGDGKEQPGAPIEQIACVLKGIDVPQSIIQRMSTTTAMAGTQEGDFGDLHASWSYHPDNGLNVVIEPRQS